MRKPILHEGSPFDDEFVDEVLKRQESFWFETKRVAGDKLTRALETIVAFANTEGGFLVLGVEDEKKAHGRDRLYGVQENHEAVDELLRLVETRITPRLARPAVFEFGCTLRDGNTGSVVLLRVDKSDSVHSIVLDGTWKRLMKGNQELVAEEITQLSLERGILTAEERLADVQFDLFDTDYWRSYAAKRRLTRSLPEAMQHLGLAKKDAHGLLKPTWAAVLLFAEEPGGLLAAKTTIRIFHYKGERIEHGPTPNLVRPPKSVSGPLSIQIAEAHRIIIDELASGVQMGPFGFEIAQRYPTRVIKEAITNAVIHRDYSLPADIQVFIFSDRIEIVSPGVLPGKVTAQNIRTVGSFNRNPLIVSNLREFPEPPNLDAGEGVRMMFHTMEKAGLYPPVYLTRASTGRDEVRVMLRNENRPSLWDQVADVLQKKGTIANADVKKIMGSDDTLAASRALREWVDRGLIEVANPDVGKRIRRYRLTETDPTEKLFFEEQQNRRIGRPELSADG